MIMITIITIIHMIIPVILMILIVIMIMIIIMIMMMMSTTTMIMIIIMSVFSSVHFKLQEIDLLKTLMISNRHLSPVNQKLKVDKDAHYMIKCQAALWICSIEQVRFQTALENVNRHCVNTGRCRERVTKGMGASCANQCLLKHSKRYQRVVYPNIVEYVRL